MEVKRICAAYWSATGNTDKTVNTIAETLAEKLGVPLEEIRKMQSGTHTVGDGMRRHLVTLERDKKNLEQALFVLQK